VLLVPQFLATTRGGLDEPKVLAVDRQSLFLAALQELLTGSPLNAEVTSVTRSDVALEYHKEAKYDLLLVDVRAEPFSGPDLAEMLREMGDPTPVMLLGESEDHRLLLEALSGPASGYFTKDISLEEFVDGVQAVLRGHKAVGRSLLQLALARIAGGALPATNPLTQLSPAERSILAMIGEARSVPSIADARGISQKTVRNHLASIYRKLDLRSRTEAVIWAVRMGLTSGVGASSQ